MFIRLDAPSAAQPASRSGFTRSNRRSPVTGGRVNVRPQRHHVMAGAGRLCEGEYMPHIALNSEEPGIRWLLRFRPETGRPISELAEVLLRGPSTLTRGERELIAAYVSALNGCRY